MTLSAHSADVLVIDDEPEIRRRLTLLLEREGHAVATASDGRQALEYLLDHGPPRLILLDLAMPTTDGWDFLVRRRQYPHLRNLPVLTFSAVVEADRPAPCDLGAAEVLRKPFDLAKLLDAARGRRAAGAPPARITFAIPFYSGTEYLRRAIDSARRQSVSDWHLLVCDDRGPGSDAEGLVRSYRDDRISYHRNAANLGMAGNWNRCLDLAATDLVTLLHADDELLADYGEVMLRAAAEHPEAAALFCEAKTIGADNRDCVSFPDLFKRVLRPRRAGPLVLRGRRALEALSHGNSIMCPTVCYRKGLLGGPRFRPEWRFALDFEFFTRLLLDSLRACAGI